jgi:hypothetical protein
MASAIRLPSASALRGEIRHGQPTLSVGQRPPADMFTELLFSFVKHLCCVLPELCVSLVWECRGETHMKKLVWHFLRATQPHKE